ncbi:MAG: nucleotidyltransferase family protein, partial [Chloroflexota bacterium]
DCPALLTHADAHSLTPLLFATWREADILDRVPVESRERMAKALRDNALRQANVRAELLEIDSILTGAGVPHLVLKGWPLAERLYADPSHRVIYDHDFLVSADKAEIGHQALLAAGFR